MWTPVSQHLLWHLQADEDQQMVTEKHAPNALEFTLTLKYHNHDLVLSLPADSYKKCIVVQNSYRIQENFRFFCSFMILIAQSENYSI